MVTRTTATKELIYGIAPVPIDPDDLPDRIPIEMIQHPTIEQLPFFLNLYLEALGEDISALLMLSNIAIRYDPSNRRLFIAPDLYIAFDVDVAAIREATFVQYMGGGQAAGLRAGGSVSIHIPEGPVRKACDIRADRRKGVLDVRPDGRKSVRLTRWRASAWWTRDTS